MKYTSGLRKFDGEWFKLHADQIGRKDTAHEYVKFLKSEGRNARVSKLDGKYAVWVGRRK